VVARRQPPGCQPWRHALAGALALALAAPPAHGAPDATPAATGRPPAAKAPLVEAAPAPERKLTYTGEAMGTVVQITFWTDDETAAAAGAEAVFAEMKRLDREMTTWTPDSEVSRINTAAGVAAVEVSDETLAVIARALDVSKRSGGVFDITVGAFKGLWKFDEDMDGTLPDPAEVKARLARIGWKDVVLDPKKKTVFLRRKGMAITLGGIAKGYAVDKCVALLRGRGFVDFIMQAGGDMFVAGKKGATPWGVGIRDPRGPRDAFFAFAPVEDHSFSTSGDYERGFVKDGVRYHHILDPHTGQPARLTRSVTIRAKDAFTADAWSKVLFIEGWEKAMPLVEKLDDFAAVFVDDQNQVHISKGLTGVIRVIKQPTPGI
jgi:thiamine biosynthesis lipoprotein